MSRRDRVKDQRGESEPWSEAKKIGHFFLSPFPGNCGIVVIHDMYLTKEYRGTMFSTHIRDGKEKLCRALGYSAVAATTQMNNIPAVKNFFKSKYNIPMTFTNKRTDNLIGIGLKGI